MKCKLLSLILISTCCWKRIGGKYLMKVVRFKATMSWVHSKHLIPQSNRVPLLLCSLIIVKFEVGMLIRYPTEEDLRMSLPQTPPAYMALLPSFSSFILHFPFVLCSPPFKSYHRFAEASLFSCLLHASLFFFKYLRTDDCLSLSLSICLFLGCSLLPLLSLLVPQPLPS